MFSIPVKNLFNSKAAVKCVIIPWMVACLILSTAFQSGLREELLFPKYEKGLQTISDLVTDNVVIYSSMNLSKMALGLPRLNKNIMLKSNAEMKNMMKSPDYSGVYTFPFLQKTVGNRKQPPKKKFLMSDEPLLTGHGVYIFRKNSPYLDRINTIIMRQRENGIFSRMNAIASTENAQPYGTVSVDQKITVFHLVGVFTIHLFGILLALIILFMEIGHLGIINCLEFS
ncbi:hypothetical protein HHI36_006532 [Cryptolaemus montrouzieri]|uniref:Uncharacterized protein n=1 Tax=Cryptolaemus montrouzieri TaxID=559131 RepID=A0ABD2NYR9_9CUCU